MIRNQALFALLLLGTAASLVGCGGTGTQGSTTPEISLGPAPDPHPASETVARAESLIADDHPAEAARLLETEVANNPGDPRAHLVLGIARTLLEDRAGAEPEFRRAIAIDANYVEARNELGLLLRDSGRLPEAIVELRAAVTARPDFHDGWYNLALAEEDAGNLAESETAYTKAIEGIGDDPVIRFQHAGLYLRMNRANDARRELLRARELAANRVDVLRAIGRTLGRAGFAEDAADTLDRAIRGSSEPSVDLFLEAAGAERSARRVERALAHARRAVAADPASARAQAMLALVASDSGDAREARAALDRAVALDTDGALREDLERLRTRIAAMH